MLHVQGSAFENSLRHAVRQCASRYHRQCTAPRRARVTSKHSMATFSSVSPGLTIIATCQCHCWCLICLLTRIAVHTCTGTRYLANRHPLLAPSGHSRAKPNSWMLMGGCDSLSMVFAGEHARLALYVYGGPERFSSNLLMPSRHAGCTISKLLSYAFALWSCEQASTLPSLQLQDCH